MQASIYCDESGNDGPNYLNADSPFYVLAGWIVPTDSHVEACVQIEKFRAKHCRDAPELKFKTFIRKPWAVCDLLVSLGQIGLVPVFVVAEKRYCIAGKVVETFLDPYYNPLLRDGFFTDKTTKQEIANSIYKHVGYSALATFAEAYRTPSELSLMKALQEILAEAKAAVNPELGALLEGSTERLSEIAEAEVEAVNSWGKAMGTLNLPCLISFIGLVDDLGKQKFISPKKIVHDEQGPYQDDYRKAFDQYKRGETFSIEGSYGAINLIEEFETQTSISQPLLQASDLLAGSIAYLCKKLLRGEKFNENELRLSSLVFPAVLMREIRLANLICSENMLALIGGAIGKAFKDESEDLQGTIVNNSELRWSSTIPDHSSLHVLPAHREVVTESATHFTVKIDLPLYSIACVRTQKVAVLLSSGKGIHEADEFEKCLPLWSSHEAADAFLKENIWTEPHNIVEYGPAEIPSLVQMLQQQAEWVKYVCFDIFTDRSSPYPILQLASEIDRIWDRFRRAARGGMINQLYKQLEIDGHEVGTMLLASGKYAAMRISDRLIATGTSRDEAIDRLQLVSGW